MPSLEVQSSFLAGLGSQGSRRSRHGPNSACRGLAVRGPILRPVGHTGSKQSSFGILKTAAQRLTGVRARKLSRHLLRLSSFMASSQPHAA